MKVKAQKKPLKKFRKPLLYPFELWGRRQTDKPTNRQTDKPTNRQIVRKLQHVCPTKSTRKTNQNRRDLRAFAISKHSPALIVKSFLQGGNTLLDSFAGGC
jgi:hypothetical protein